MALPTFGASGTATAGGTRSTISLAAPASVVANSIVVAVIFIDGSTDQNPTLAGWAEKTNTGPGTGGSGRLHVLWHRASGSEAGPYAFVLDASVYCEGQVHRFDAAITTGDPLEADNAANSGSGSTTTPNVSLTTLGADRLLLHAATNWSGGTWTAPASPGTWTKRQQVAPDGLSTLADAGFATAGGTGNVTATCTGAGQPNAWLGALIPANAGAAPEPRRASVPLTHVGSSAWVAPASGAAVAPNYPSGLQDATTTQTDMVYAFLHIKPDTATVATPANWDLVGTETGGAGAVGAGTGATRVHVYRRVGTAALSGGSQSFTITGGSSPVAFMRAYRAFGNNLSFVTEVLTSWSVAAQSTTIGGTAGAALNLDVLDDVNIILGTPDDQSSTLTLTGLTATGATLDTLTRDPNATVTNAQGNDISATAYRTAVLAGSSTSAPVATATSSSSETAMGLLMRVRATGEVAPPAVYTVPGLAVIQRACW